MAAARKFGLYLTLATQTLAQVSEGRNQELGKALLGNAGSIMLFRLGAPDAQKMESYMGSDLTARDLENLANFQVAARLLVNGRPIRPFAFDTPAPPPPVREFPRARQELLEQARQAHTRPVADVEGALLLRREELSC